MKLDNVIAVRKDKTIYRDGDAMLKVFNPECPKHGILNEALNQARVELTGLNIPKVREVITIDGKWTIVSDFIEGETLTALSLKYPEKQEEYMNLFVDLQIEVLSHKCQLLGRLKDKMHAKISASDFPATVRYDLHTTLESMPKHRDKAAHVAGVVERHTELPHGINLIGILKPRPLLGLGLLNEGNQRIYIQSQIRVVCICAFDITASRRQEGRFDI